MALDIAILGKDGAPTDQIELGVEGHSTLLEQAIPKENFPLINRIADYYEDASFSPDEVLKLKKELEQIKFEGLKSTIGDLVAISTRAIAAKKGLEVIAD